jgi:hypothetical protein
MSRKGTFWAQCSWQHVSPKDNSAEVSWSLLHNDYANIPYLQNSTFRPPLVHSYDKKMIFKLNTKQTGTLINEANWHVNGPDSSLPLGTRYSAVNPGLVQNRAVGHTQPLNEKFSWHTLINTWSYTAHHVMLHTHYTSIQYFCSKILENITVQAYNGNIHKQDGKLWHCKRTTTVLV